MLRHPLFSDDASLSFHDDISLPWIWSFYPVIFLKFHEFAFGFLHHLALHEQAAFAALAWVYLVSPALKDLCFL